MGAVFYGSFWLEYLLRIVVYPSEHIDIISGVPVLGDGKFTGVAIFSGLILAMPLGFIITNIIVWLVPSWRAIDSEAAKGVPGASFTEANRGLLFFAIIPLIFFAVCTILAVLYR